MDTHMCSCRPSVCPHFIHLFLFCMHTCKYSEYAESKKRFRHSTGLFSLLPAQFAVFGLSFIELALYTWLTPSSSSATITPRCQQVPVLSAQALPALRGTRHGLGFVSRATMWCSRVFFFFVYLEKEECHIHLAFHCQHRSLPRELAGTMRCHSRPPTTSLWAGRSKTSWFLIIFPLLSYLIYFHHRLLAFHHPCGSDTHSKNNTYQTTLCNRGLQDRSEA